MLLIDPSGKTDRVYDPSDLTRPSYVLLGPGAEVLALGSSITDKQIEAALPTAYP